LIPLLLETGRCLPVAIYTAHHSEIIKFIKILNRPKKELIDFIYCAANIKTLVALPELRKQMFPSLIITAEEMEFAKYRDAAGNEVSISLIVSVWQ